MEMILENRNCIKIRRLFEAAAGAVRLEEREHQHLHECRVCQGVLHIFITVHRDILLTESKKHTPAA